MAAPPSLPFYLAFFFQSLAFSFSLPVRSSLVHFGIVNVSRMPSRIVIESGYFSSLHPSSLPCDAMDVRRRTFCEVKACYKKVKPDCWFLSTTSGLSTFSCTLIDKDGISSLLETCRSISSFIFLFRVSSFDSRFTFITQLTDGSCGLC